MGLDLHAKFLVSSTILTSFRERGGGVIPPPPLKANPLNSPPRLGLIPLGLKAAASATDTTMHKKKFGSGVTKLTISNEEMNIMKIVRSLEESGLLIKGVTETIKSEAKEQKGGFLGMSLGTLGASLLRNLLTGNSTIKGSEGTIRAGKKI